jgi:anaerobic ribonucleoside-triphosphate reductase activating protein
LQQLKNKNDSDINKLLEFTDILIDGQYVDNLNDGISLRGSSNQKIHLLTNRYLDVFDNYYNKAIREIEIHMNNENMMIVGIPIQETLYKILHKAKL